MLKNNRFGHAARLVFEQMIAKGIDNFQSNDKIRFLVIGALNSCFSYICLPIIIITGLVENETVGFALAYTICTAVSFTTHKSITFKVQRFTAKQATFVIKELVNLSCVYFIYWSTFIVAGVNIFIVNAILVIISAIISYLFMKYLVFAS